MINVSICICVYNRAAMIAQCLESVLPQTHNNAEIVVIDDGSQDNTQTKLNKFKKDSRIRIYRNDKNTGVSAARNKGINLSQGSIVAFLDVCELDIGLVIRRHGSLLLIPLLIFQIYCEFRITNIHTLCQGIFSFNL